jgi:redox-sensing transcriptional repressor
MDLMIDKGKKSISSHELGKQLGFSSSQIRKDLSQFGEFGKQGTGYDVGYLSEQLRRILNVNHIWDVALVGFGNLGQAVASYSGFIHRGFRIVALYENDPEKVGSKIGDLVIQDISEMVEDIRHRNIKIAMLAVPTSEAQNTAKTLIQAGVRAILSYAPITIAVPNYVRIEYIDPVSRLQQMTYYLE